VPKITRLQLSLEELIFKSLQTHLRVELGECYRTEDLPTVDALASVAWHSMYEPAGFQ
jgi:hypothetical protein